MSDTRRRQLKVNYPGQLFTPAELQVGQDIAVLQYEDRLPLHMRTLRAASNMLITKVFKKGTPGDVRRYGRGL